MTTPIEQLRGLRGKAYNARFAELWAAASESVLLKLENSRRTHGKLTLGELLSVIDEAGLPFAPTVRALEEKRFLSTGFMDKMQRDGVHLGRLREQLAEKAKEAEA